MSYRIYDHRVKQLVVATGNPELFPELRIPRSTALTWIRNGVREVVTARDLDQDYSRLIVENRELKAKVESSEVVLDVTIATFRIFGLQIQFKRLPTAEAKANLIGMIKSAAEVSGLSKVLDAIGLSRQRYQIWLNRQRGCSLEDHPSCPKLTPSKVPNNEIKKIKDYVTSKEYAHFSIPSLVWFARRAGEVYASAAIWYRVIKEFKLRRTNMRVYPNKRTLGIRASLPNQIWHIDQTIIRLEDRTRVFIQSIIDNYSRFVLATNVTLKFGGAETISLLKMALTRAKALGAVVKPTILADDGTENSNRNVSSFLGPIGIALKIAQIDVEFSNSMIEAFFKALKYRHLFCHPLTTWEAVVKQVEYYCHQHNETIPQNVLGGGTPIELFTGKWTSEEQLTMQCRVVEARASRRTVNLAMACGACP
ncbi:MAG: hypothetical protein AB7T49_14690 [Oligoflexales bacterium]